MDRTQASEVGSIFILDDDRPSREALRIMLQRAGYHVTCFADVRALLNATQRRSPSCIFLDLMLQTNTGLEILAGLAEYAAPILVTSSQASISIAVDVIKAGAVDFIPRPFSSQQIVQRLEHALGPRRDKNFTTARPSAWNFPGQETLSDREKQVLDLIAAGTSSKEAGFALGISPRTVDDHRANLMRKLGVRNATELMIAVLKWSSRHA